MVTSAATDDGEIISETLRSFGEEEGVFGVLTENDSGTVDIIALDQPAAAEHVDVVNGAFSATSLTSLRGRFLAVFTGEEGRSFSRQFNKDASSYFLLMDEGEAATGNAESAVTSSAIMINPVRPVPAGHR